MAVLSHGHSIGLTLEAGRSKVLAALVAVVPLIGQAFALCFHSNSELLADLSNHALGLVGDHNGQLGCGGHHDGALSGSLLGLDQIGSVDRDTIKVISGGEISGNGIVVRVENVLEQHGGLLLAINLSQIIHEAVAQLNSRSALVASAQSNVERVVQIGGRLGAQSVAIVLGSHVSIDLICLILGTLIVQGILGVGAGADCGQVGVGQAGQNPTIAAGSDLQRLQILVVRIVEGVEPLGIANIISVGEAVSVLVAVISDPSHNICPVIGKVVIVTVGDHIQRGVAAALALPQVVTPVVVSATLHRNLVDNGGGNAISIVVVVGTAGSEYIEELVRIGNSLVSCQHLLCSHQVAVQVGRTGRHILNGLQTVLDNVLVVLLGQEGQFHCHIVVVLNSNQTQLDIMTLQNQRLNQVNDGIVGVRISAVYAVILCDTGTQGQDDVHIILGMVLDGDGGIVFGSTDQSLGSVLTIFGKIANNIDCAFFSTQGLQTQQVVVQSFHTSGACGVLHSFGGVLGQIVGQFVGVIVEDLAPTRIIHNRISSSVGVVSIIGALPDSQLNGCDDITAGQIRCIFDTCCDCRLDHIRHGDIGIGVGDNRTQLFCYFYREYVFNSLVGVNILVFSANAAVSTINNLKVAFAENIFTGIFPALCDVIIQKNEVLRNCGIVGVVTDFISGSGEMKNISILYIYFEVILNVNNFEGNVFAETDIAIGSDKFGQLVGTNLHIGEGQLAVGVNGSHFDGVAISIHQRKGCAGQRIAVLVDLLDHDVRAVNHGVSNTGNGEHNGLAFIAFAVNGIQGCGQVGIDGISTGFLCLLRQLQLVGQRSSLFNGHIIAKGPDELLGILTVAVVVIQEEICFTISAELVRSGSAFLGLDLRGGIGNTAADHGDGSRILNKFKVALVRTVVTNVIFYIGACCAGVQDLIFDGIKEGQITRVVVDGVLAAHHAHKVITNLIIFQPGGFVTGFRSLADCDCIAVEAQTGERNILAVYILQQGGDRLTDGSLHLTIDHQRVILCALIVQSVCSIDSSNGVGSTLKFGNSNSFCNLNVFGSLDGIAPRFNFLLVSSPEIAIVLFDRSKDIVVLIGSDPTFNIAPVILPRCDIINFASFILNIECTGDYIALVCIGVGVTSIQPILVAGHIVALLIMSTGNGRRITGLIVEPIGQTGGNYDHMLAIGRNIFVGSQHIASGDQRAFHVDAVVDSFCAFQGSGNDIFHISRHSGIGITFSNQGFVCSLSDCIIFHRFGVDLVRTVIVSAGKTIVSNRVAGNSIDHLGQFQNGLFFGGVSEADHTDLDLGGSAVNCDQHLVNHVHNIIVVAGRTVTDNKYDIGTEVYFLTGDGQGDIHHVVFQLACDFVDTVRTNGCFCRFICKSGQADTGADCDRQHKRKQSLHFVCHVFILLSNI